MGIVNTFVNTLTSTGARSATAPMGGGGTQADGQTAVAQFASSDGSNYPGETVLFVYNGASWDKLRTPNTFKTATATASGNTAVWTPAAGKKFRLMGYVIYITEQATLGVAGNEEVTFQDAAAAIGLGFSNFVPAAAVAGTVPASSGVIQLGNGFLSATANNALNVNLGTALTAGECRVTVWGTEE